MTALRPYRTTLSRAIQSSEDRYCARPLDAEEMTFIERIRDTGRLDCDSFASAVEGQNYWGSNAAFAGYRNVDDCMDAIALARIWKEPVPPYNKSVTACPMAKPKEYAQQIQTYEKRWKAWELRIKVKINKRSAAYAAAMFGVRTEMADIEAKHRAQSLERIALIEKQEAERAKHYRERQVARARAELRQAEDKEARAEMRAAHQAWRAEQRRSAEERQRMAVQRARDDAEWDLAERTRKLAPAAAERDQWDRAEQEIDATVK